MNHINYRSDFCIRLHGIAFDDDDDYEVYLRTDTSHFFYAYKTGDEASGIRNDAGDILIIADSHGLGAGRVYGRIVHHAQDGNYEDGARAVVDYFRTNLVLTTDSGEVSIEDDEDEDITSDSIYGTFATTVFFTLITENDIDLTSENDEVYVTAINSYRNE